MIEYDFKLTLSILLSVLVIAFTWFRTRRHDVDEQFKSGTARLDRYGARINALEQTITDLPGKDDMHALQLELARMVGSLGQMQAVMEGNAKIMERLESIVRRHEDHLLEGHKR